MSENKYSITELKSMKFGYFSIIKEVAPRIYHYPNRDAKMRMMLCECRCGTEKVVSLNNLIRGSTVSCGCYKKQFLINQGLT